MRCDYPHGIGGVTEAQRNQPKLTSSKPVAELGLEQGWSDSEHLLSPGCITPWKREPQPRSVRTLTQLSTSEDSSMRGQQAGRPGVSRWRKEAAGARHFYVSQAAGRNKPAMFSSLYKFKRRFLSTCCVAMTPGLT